jgi:hypothetical protein
VKKLHFRFLVPRSSRRGSGKHKGIAESTLGRFSSRRANRCSGLGRSKSRVLRSRREGAKLNELTKRLRPALRRSRRLSCIGLRSSRRADATCLCNGSTECTRRSDPAENLRNCSQNMRTPRRDDTTTQAHTPRITSVPAALPPPVAATNLPHHTHMLMQLRAQSRRPKANAAMGKVLRSGSIPQGQTLRPFRRTLATPASRSAFATVRWLAMHAHKRRSSRAI